MTALYVIWGLFGVGVLGELLLTALSGWNSRFVAATAVLAVGWLIIGLIETAWVLA